MVYNNHGYNTCEYFEIKKTQYDQGGKTTTKENEKRKTETERKGEKEKKKQDPRSRKNAQLYNIICNM